jgi:Tfp pilus assembly protein PilV
VEAIVALLIVGLGVTALLGALAQERRTLRQTEAWRAEQECATNLLMEELRRWEQLRSEEGRRSSLATHGEDPLLGAWTWEAQVVEASSGQPVGLYRVTLRWQDHEVQTHAALRVLQG